METRIVNENLTHLLLIVDRSGSMEGFAVEASGGINQLLREQAEHDGECNVTLVHFDHLYEVVCSDTPIDHVDEYRLRPRGMTALYDAMGRGLIHVGKILEAMREKARPGHVICAIVTDGLENASKEFTFEGVRDMIQVQRDVYGWQFLFLCADPTAAKVAVDVGVPTCGVAVYSPGAVETAYVAASNAVRRSRSGGVGGQTASFTDAERDAMTGTGDAS